MKWMFKSTSARALVVLFLLPALWPTLVLALPLQEAGIVTTLSGRAAVTRVSLPQSVPLHFKDRVYLGDKISTAEDSTVRVLLGGKALVTVRELSVFSITEQVGKSTVNLTEGKVSLAVARKRMAPGEVVEVRTPNAVAAVRGTVLLVDVEPSKVAANGPTAPPTTTTFTVIKGLVTVQGIQPGSPEVNLSALQSLRVIGNTFGTVNIVKPGAIVMQLKSLRSAPQITESPQESGQQTSQNETSKAMALVETVLGPQEALDSDEGADEEGKKKRRGSRSKKGGQGKKGEKGLSSLLSQVEANAAAAATGISLPTVPTMAPVTSTSLLNADLLALFNGTLPLVVPPSQHITTGNVVIVPSVQTQGLLTGTIALYSTITQSGIPLTSSLSSTLTVFSQGPMTWTGGTMNQPGLTYVNGGLVDGPVTLEQSRRLVNYGTLTWAGTSPWTVDSNAILENHPIGTFAVQGAASMTFGGNGLLPQFVNGGQLTKSVDPGTTTIGAGFINLPGASVNVQTGTLQFNGENGLSTGGTYSVASGATIGFGGTGVTLQPGVSVGGAGRVLFNGGLTDVQAGYNVAGLTEVTGGAVLFNGTGKNTGALTVSGGFLSGTGNVTSSGPLTWTGGSIIDSGTLTVNGGSVTGGVLQDFGRQIVNTGTLTWTGPSVWGVQRGTVFTNQSGTTFSIQGDLLHMNDLGGGAVPQFINQGTVDKTLAGIATIDAVFTNSNQVQVQGGTLEFAGGGTSTGSFALTGGSTLQFDGGIYDLQSGSMTGTATETVSVSNGTLQKTGAGTISVGPTVTNAATIDVQSGTLRLTGGGSSTGTIQGAGTFEVNGGTFTASSGAYNLSGGTTDVTSGTLAIGVNGANLGTANVADGATLQINNAGVTATSVTLNGAGVGAAGALQGIGTASLGGPIALAAPSNYVGVAAGGVFTLSGNIGGANGLTKVGTGTLILGGANAYTGGTTINEGTLSLSGGSALADTGAVTVATAAGTLNLLSGETIGALAGVAGSNVTLNANTLTTGDGTSTTFSGAMSGSGGLTKLGTGIFTLAGANTYTGATTIDAGTLTLAGGSAVADTGAVVLANAAGATLTLLASETIGALAGGGPTGGDVSLNAHTLTTGDGSDTSFSGVLSGPGGSLTKQGGGLFTLNGANTYTGTTTVTAGTLAVTANEALGTVAGATTVASGATLELNGNITVGENVALNTGALAGVSTPTLSGTLTLGAGDNTVAVAAPADTLTLSGVVSGAGNLAKTGGGTVAFADTGLVYRLSGTTTVSGGTLSTTGDLAAIQTGEALTLTGTMLGANGGVIDVDRAIVRVPFDGINPVGTVVANGTAPLVLLTTGTHPLATTSGEAMFNLAGNPANTSVETIDLGLPGNILGEDVALTLATDRPLRGSGTCPDCKLQSTLLEGSGATVSAEKILKVDAALVEATVPILRLLAASTLTLNGDAVTLANMAKLVSGTGVTSAMLALDASSMTINVGALINVSGGSFLNVLGDLVRLSNGSTLTLNDATGGYVLRVSGTSVVDIAGALIDFTGTGNTVKVANTSIPSLTVGGVSVSLAGGALPTQVEILGTPIRGLANGVIENLVGEVLTGSLIEIHGTDARVRIKGN